MNNHELFLLYNFETFRGFSGLLCIFEFLLCMRHQRIQFCVPYPICISWKSQGYSSKFVLVN